MHPDHVWHYKIRISIPKGLKINTLNRNFKNITIHNYKLI